MFDNTLPSITTTDTSAYSPDVSFDVSLVQDELGNFSGTITGGDTSEIVQALEEVKELQAETNSILMNISVACLLFVALLGVVIAQGFVKFLRKR